MPTIPNARALALAGTLAVSACAHPVPASMEPAMAATATPAAHDARSLLSSLLDLIRATPRVADLTPERLGDAMHAEVKTFGPASYYGFGGRIDANWAYSVTVDQAAADGARLDLMFGPVPANATPEATAICDLDFDQVQHRLTADGFKHEPRYGEHGQILEDVFRAGATELTVRTQNATSRPTVPVRRCVVGITVT